MIRKATMPRVGSSGISRTKAQIRSKKLFTSRSHSGMGRSRVVSVAVSSASRHPSGALKVITSGARCTGIVRWRKRHRISRMRWSADQERRSGDHGSPAVGGVDVATAYRPYSFTGV